MASTIKTPVLLRRVILDYLETGNYSEAARRNGIDTSLPLRWKKLPDWHDIEQELIEQIDSETKARFRRIMNKAVDRAEERLRDGDMVALKGGQLVSVPVRARDCAVIASIAFEKLRLLEGKATRITEDSSRIQTMLDQFTEMGKAYRQGNVLPGELVEHPGSPEGAGEGQILRRPKHRNPRSPATDKSDMPSLTRRKNGVDGEESGDDGEGRGVALPD